MGRRRRRSKRKMDDNQIENQGGAKRQAREKDDDPSEPLRLAELPDPLTKLRLEAIFHPKFENERSDHTIRQDMLSRVENGKGYLEVSLKHSGSLVLWSGGLRFYSKNSTENKFTYTAEILLQQHFERAWRNDGSGESSLSSSSLSQYESCSKYAEENRLTLAFELVTSVLGDHGDIPKKDFMVLTAVADRTNERFFSTAEVMRFAQRFRLPHNDTWMFSSSSSAKSLFELYDNNMETGLATDTVEALTKAAEAHVPSMYPHVVFQGEILEGYIVRFVPYRNQPVEEVLEALAQLSAEASNILENVPPDLPLSFEVDSIAKENVPGLSVNIRTLFKGVDGFNRGNEATRDFAAALEKELNRIGQRRGIERVNGQHLDLPSLAQSLVESDDEETKRIALMLQKLDNLHKAVSYSFLVEEQPTTNDLKKIRHLCVINVLHDQAFLKFQKGMEPGDMALFRGFSIELSGDESTPLKDGSATPAAEEIPKGDDSLMLKKKLLPYMVRTFICRNCLSIIQTKGPLDFVSQAIKLLKRWEISETGLEKWVPFFEAWADYAVSCFEDGGDPSLPPLSDFSYLAHLDHFTKLYERGELNQKPKSSFRGAVFLVAPTTSLAAQLAKIFGEALDGATPRSIEAVAQRSVLRGVVAYSGIGQIPKGIRPYLEDVSGYSTFVFVGCSEKELEIEFAVAENNEKKRMMGLSDSWRKLPCAARVDLERSILSRRGRITSVSAFQETVTKIQALSPPSTSQVRLSPGLVLFFPQIPGCGKSTVVSTFENDFKEYCTSKSSTNSNMDEILQRKILVRVSDQMNKKYWPILKRDVRNSPSCILIADKNTPLPSLKVVADVCSESNSLPVAVFPDMWAMQTTEIFGIRFMDGGFSEGKKHVYPFSLAYLAVCMSRVLSRKKKSHAGKLDVGTPAACMIVIMFFSLYRGMTAESFQEAVDMKLSKPDETLSHVKLPFFEGPESIEVPSEVQKVLVEALQLQFGYDIKKQKTKIQDQNVADMEKRLRAVLREHSDALLSKTASIKTTKEALYQQLFERASILNSRMGTDNKEPNQNLADQKTTTKETKKEAKIRLVSIDVEKSKVHEVLTDHNAGKTSIFLNSIFDGIREKDRHTKNGIYIGNEFIDNTHVTMAFHSRTTQTSMRESFGPVLGCDVDVLVTGLVWSKNHAAFAVSTPDHTVDKKPLPPCQNSFAHITVWKAHGSQSVGSNDLLDLVSQGQAHRADFETPIQIRGKLSFWK